MVSSEDLDSRRCTNSAVSEEVWNSLKVSTSAAAIVEMDGSRRHCRDVICSLVDRTPARRVGNSSSNLGEFTAV